MLISFSGRTKQIFFLVIKLEPQLLPWLQPTKNNSAPTELDVSISASDLVLSYLLTTVIKNWFGLLTDQDIKTQRKAIILPFSVVNSYS